MPGVEDNIAEFANKNGVNVTADEVKQVMDVAKKHIEQLKEYLGAIFTSENVQKAAQSFRTASVEAMAYLQQELESIAKQNKDKFDQMDHLEAIQVESSRKIAELEAQVAFLYKFVFGFIIFLCLLLLTFDKCGSRKKSETIIYQKNYTKKETDEEFEI